MLTCPAGVMVAAVGTMWWYEEKINKSAELILSLSLSMLRDLNHLKFLFFFCLFV
jgi:hypothetical protein